MIIIIYCLLFQDFAIGRYLADGIVVDFAFSFNQISKIGDQKINTQNYVSTDLGFSIQSR